MANTHTLYKCSEDDSCHVSCEERNGIIDVSIMEGGRINSSYLDIPTAVKFVKDLKLQISKAKEVNNG